MQLVERGKIDLDAPVAQYLPYFRLDDDRYREMTIRQMLSHTSGMPDMEESEYDELVAHPEVDEGAAERYVRGLSHLKLVAAPGERFFYSNIAYNVLGDLIAKVSGQTFEDYMKEHILRPAGMPGQHLLLSRGAAGPAGCAAPAHAGDDRQPDLPLPPRGCPRQLPAYHRGGDVPLGHHLPEPGHLP